MSFSQKLVLVIVGMTVITQGASDVIASDRSRYGIAAWQMAQAPASTKSLTPQQISLRAKQVTVRIDGQGTGSGVIIGQAGQSYTVLTNWHVVETPGEYTVQTPDGRTYAANYNAVKRLPGVDLAIIQFNTDQNYQVAEIGNSDAASEGMSIYYAGYPGSLRDESDRFYRFFPVSIVAVLPTPTENGYSLVYNGEALTGMSGGPVLDQNGFLIGIHGQAFIDPRTGSPSVYAVPINTYKQLAQKAQSTGTTAATPQAPATTASKPATTTSGTPTPSNTNKPATTTSKPATTASGGNENTPSSSSTNTTAANPQNTEKNPSTSDPFNNPQSPTDNNSSGSTTVQKPNETPPSNNAGGNGDVVINPPGGIPTFSSSNTNQTPTSSSPAPSTNQAPTSSSPAPSTNQAPTSSSPAPSTNQAPTSSSPAPSTNQTPTSSSPAPSTNQTPTSSSPAPSTNQTPTSSSPAPNWNQAPTSSSPAPNWNQAPTSSSPAPNWNQAPTSSSPAPASNSNPSSTTGTTSNVNTSDNLLISSVTGIDYRPLRDLLAQKKWQEADLVTGQLFDSLVLIARTRNSSEFIDLKQVSELACLDISTMDRLWGQSSDSRFGFRQQQQIWTGLATPGNYSTDQWRNFATQVGWKQGDVAKSTGYLLYDQLKFDPTQSPVGHLPWWFGYQEDYQTLIKYMFSHCSFDPDIERQKLEAAAAAAEAEKHKKPGQPKTKPGQQKPKPESQKTKPTSPATPPTTQP